MEVGKSAVWRKAERKWWEGWERKEGWGKPYGRGLRWLGKPLQPHPPPHFFPPPLLLPRRDLKMVQAWRGKGPHHWWHQEEERPEVKQMIVCFRRREQASVPLEFIEGEDLGGEGASASFVWTWARGSPVGVLGAARRVFPLGWGDFRWTLASLSPPVTPPSSWAYTPPGWLVSHGVGFFWGMESARL